MPCYVSNDFHLLGGIVSLSLSLSLIECLSYSRRCLEELNQESRQLSPPFCLQCIYCYNICEEKVVKKKKKSLLTTIDYIEIIHHTFYYHKTVTRKRSHLSLIPLLLFIMT